MRCTEMPEKVSAEESTEKHLPWTEKYRPLNLSEVVAHETIIDVIRKFAANGRLPHLLFHGPPGTGKTSTVLALTRELYESNHSNMVLELNASDSRGINIVRDEIQSFASTARPFSSAFKLVIMDECDSLTKDAQFALRRIMEKYAQHTRFCLICNYASKIIPAIQSRCTKFRFAPVPAEAMLQRLRHVVCSERVQISGASLQTIQRLGEGDMRRSLNVLQSLHLASTKITSATIHATTGLLDRCEVLEFLQVLFEKPMKSILNHLYRLKLEKSFALTDLIKEMSETLFSLHMSVQVRSQLLKGLADVEHALSFTSSEKIQTLSLISIFLHVRRTLTTSDNENQLSI